MGSIYDLYDTGNKYLVPSGDPEPTAFGTNPIVLAEPKSVYGPDDTGNKHLQPSGFLDQNNMPYRSSSFGIATPRSVTDAKIGLGYWEIQSFKHAPQIAAGKAK